MADLMQEGKEPIPAAVEPDESSQLLGTLEQEYNISLLPTDLATIQEMGFELLPQDGLAHISGTLQQIPGLLHGRNLQNTYQETYAEAYRLLIPEGCSNDSKMKISKLAEEFGPDAESMEFIGPDGRVKRHGGVQKIDPPEVRAQQIAYLAFSAASVATSQYFLYRIDKKLEAIESTTTEILQFLELDKQTELQGSYDYLSDCYANLHSIMADDKLLQATLQQIESIIADSLRSIRFYQKQALDEMSSVKESMDKHANQVPKQVGKARSNLSNYWLAVFVHEFAVTLKLLLTQNTSSQYIGRLQEKLSKQISEYGQSCQSYQELVHEYVWKEIEALPEAKQGLDWFAATSKILAYETKRNINRLGPLGLIESGIDGAMRVLEGPATVVGAAAVSMVAAAATTVAVSEKVRKKRAEEDLDNVKTPGWKGYAALFAAGFAGSFAGLTDAELKNTADAHLKRIKDAASAEMALYALPEQIQPETLNRIADSIGELDRLYHGPIELAISGDQIYFRPINKADAAAEEEQKD